MDPELLSWATTEEAQPYLQKFGITPDRIQRFINPQQNYSSMLMSLMQDNPQNPDFQKQMLGYYLDYTNPQNQQVDENQLNTALSLISSEDPTMQEWGKMLIQQSYPQLASGMGGAGDMDLGGYQADSLRSTYGEPAETETDPRKRMLYDLLASGKEDVTNTYYGAKPKFSDYFLSSPWKALLGGVEARPKTREGAVRSAYGLN